MAYWPWRIPHHPYHFTASLGDLLAVFALLIAWITYRQARLASGRADVNTATALLQALSERFFVDIGSIYFSTAYTEAVAEKRSKQYRGNLEVVYHISPESVAALAGDQRAAAEGLISQDTVKLAAVALWQISKINGLIRQQATFNAVHAPDFYDTSLSAGRREAVHQAGVAMSKFLHGGIGNAKEEWYEPLRSAVQADLTKLGTRNWWWNYACRNVWEPIGDLLVAVVVIVVFAGFVHIL